VGSNLDFVQAYLDKAWANPPASVAETSMKFLADDFKSLDIDGSVLMDKQMYIGMGQMLFASFTGFRWVLKGLREEDGIVYMTGHFEGTHTSDLDMSAMGAGVIPASGKKVTWPDTTVKVTVKDNKLTSEQTTDPGGMAAFLEPLGVKMPSS
jgi:hypothetical protein